MTEEPVENDLEESEGLDTELSEKEIASQPSDTGDPSSIVDLKIPEDIRKKYEIYNYRNAATILCETRKSEFEDLLKALRAFEITSQMIRTAGGNESQIPKLFSSQLRPLGWFETVVQGDLIVKQTWRERTSASRKSSDQKKSKEIRREKYLDGHKIDYVKGRVAFDLEWNSKDQTFDRDLYAFSAFFQCGVIDASVLVTRSQSLNPVFRELGEALQKDGITVERKKSGVPRMIYEKYGASTTWMGKLLYRLNAGRNGGCPVLVVGITPACIKDWKSS